MTKNVKSVERRAKSSQVRPSPEMEKSRVRGISTKSTVLVAALAGALSTTAAESQDKGYEKVRAASDVRLDQFQLMLRDQRVVHNLKAVIRDAVESGDINSAIRVHGEELPEEVQKQLKSLTKQDLEEIKRLQSKLGHLDRKLGLIADNNGIVGM